MSESPDSPSMLLGSALAGALERAVGTSLLTLHSLRDAVDNYTIHQKSRGISLDGVRQALTAAILDVEDERGLSTDPMDSHDAELSRQVQSWCGEVYANRNQGSPSGFSPPDFPSVPPVSAAALADYVRSASVMSDDADPVVIRRCEKCGEDRILEPRKPDEGDVARCGCGLNSLDEADLEALGDRGP
jgi:hypothetical protein